MLTYQWLISLQSIRWDDWWGNLLTQYASILYIFIYTVVQIQWQKDTDQQVIRRSDVHISAPRAHADISKFFTFKIFISQTKKWMNLSQILSRWFLIPVSEVEVFTQNFTHAPEGVLPVIHEEVLHLNTKKKKTVYRPRNTQTDQELRKPQTAQQCSRQGWLVQLTNHSTYWNINRNMQELSIHTILTCWLPSSILEEQSV